MLNINACINIYSVAESQTDGKHFIILAQIVINLLTDFQIPKQSCSLGMDLIWL